MIRFLRCAVVSLFLAGCSQVTAPIVQKVTDDLTRTSELAEKYGKPEVKECADFLVASMGDFQKVNEKLKELEAEPTSGVFSDVFKKVLLADLLKQQVDAVDQDAFQKGFEDSCSKVSGKIMFAIVKDAVKFAPVPKP